MRLIFIEDFEIESHSFFGRCGQSSILVEYQALISMKNSGLIYSLYFLDPYVDLFISSIDMRLVIHPIIKVLKESYHEKVDELVEFLLANTKRDGFFVFFGD